MRPTGLKTYDKRSKRAVFECVIPGTKGRKRVRKVTQVTSWDDLLNQLKTFRDSILETVIALPEIPTLRAYITEQWETYAARLSNEKRRSSEAILEHHLLPLLGNIRIGRITTAHAEDVISAMRKKTYGDKRKYSNAYINTALHLLRGVLFHAYRRRLLLEAPFAREKLPFLVE